MTSTQTQHPTGFEAYCETIFELAEDDVKVIQARIAERLEVSRPAVSEMISRLESEGLVALSGNEIHLTLQGEKLATKVVRRHRVAERFLTDILGLSWAAAHHEAGAWEHVLSNEVEQAMLKLLNDPQTCPHGNPIPGSGYVAPPLTQLSIIEVGSKFKVVRIPEELEFESGMLEFLEQSSIIPGKSGKLLTISPDGAATVEIETRVVGIGKHAAERILVATI